MTRDKIQQLAKDAGMNTSMWNYGAGSMAFTMGIEGVARGAIERFAALVAAVEREECAISCEVHAARVINDGKQPAWAIAHECAAAIRARKPA